LQIATLKRAGCKRIFTDTASGASRQRPQLDKCLRALKAGDMLTVWKLDRLGRSLPHLVGVLESLKGQGVGFRSLTEAIDTESATGRLLGHIIGALAEFERGLVIERTQAGLKAAKQRGVKLGRKPKLSPATGATRPRPDRQRRQPRACRAAAWRGAVNTLCSAGLIGERCRNTNAGRFPFVRVW
jgi:DNA invertase Pin-like site-specific DNA recombinase